MNRSVTALFRIGLGSIFLCSAVLWCRGDESGAGSEPDDASARSAGPMSWTRPSLDGVIAWTDQYMFHQWRIQQHVETHECRLLDEDGKTQATGRYEECLAKLEAIKEERKLPPMQGRGVVLLHGLAAPCWSMNLLARHLHKYGGFEVFPIDYASLRSDIDHQARSLANVINSLHGIEEIHLVGHSMGNIVIRRYLAGDSSPEFGWRPDPRIARIVMIAPPNHGSITATRLSDYTLFRTLFGRAGRQLGSEWSDLEPRLATPQVEFGIIAGGYGNQLGLNPFLPGDDDGRITVETTRLAGAADFLVVPAVHEFIANDPRVFNYTLNFLNAGHFLAADRRQAIPYGPTADGQRSPRR